MFHEGLPGVLINWDDNHECLWDIQVDKKGPVDWVVRWNVEKLDNTGYPGLAIALKSDQEPSIMPSKTAVAPKRAGTTTPIDFPMGSHNAMEQSNMQFDDGKGS